MAGRTPLPTLRLEACQVEVDRRPDLRSFSYSSLACLGRLSCGTSKSKDEPQKPRGVCYHRGVATTWRGMRRG